MGKKKTHEKSNSQYTRTCTRHHNQSYHLKKLKLIAISDEKETLLSPALL
jgi:hypothetical protein